MLFIFLSPYFDLVGSYQLLHNQVGLNAVPKAPTIGRVLLDLKVTLLQDMYLTIYRCSATYTFATDVIEVTR